jgi:hypothetical protein
VVAIPEGMSGVDLPDWAYDPEGGDTSDDSERELTREEIIQWHVDNKVFKVDKRGRVWRVKRKVGHNRLAKCKRRLADKHLTNNGYRRVTFRWVTAT